MGVENVAPPGFDSRTAQPYRIAIPTELPGPTKKSENKKNFLALGNGSIGCAETSVRNYHYTLRNSTEERRLIIQISLRNIQQCFEIKKKNNFQVLRTSLVSWRPFWWTSTKISKEPVVIASDRLL